MSAPACDLDAVLRERFGFGSFRPGQRELIEAVLGGRDALGVLPTGGGKSLIYQLPATLLPGVTVVISPLIALMKDQVDAFNRRGGQRAVALHSNLSGREVFEALAAAEGGAAALVYVAPERLEIPAHRARILGLRPRLFVIDEAHCVNQWGYDFRPSYLALKEAVRVLRPAPVLALTATATPETRLAIVEALQLVNPLIHVASFDRPNLRFEVHPCGTGEKPRRLRRILKDLEGRGSQIVYVGRRKDAEEIAADLALAGLRAVPYHAGMTPAARKEAQEAWLSGARPVAVATLAFGMGIDKPDVRAVVHFQHPASLEAYYQEAGRAGRDGLPAACITLHSAQDDNLARFFLRRRYPSLDQVKALYAAVPPAGIRMEDLARVQNGLTDEQRHVGLFALQEQGQVWRGEDSLLHREEGAPEKAFLKLDEMFKRKDADYRRLDTIIAYCQKAPCHRAALLRYFGEPLAADYRCGNCSACSGGTAHVAQAALEDELERVLRRDRAILEAHQPLGARVLRQYLQGSDSKRVLPGWRELPGYGALSHVPSGLLMELAERVLERLDGEAAPDTRGNADRPAQEAARPLISRSSAAGLGDQAVFWQSRDRSFTVGELRKREVARARGLAILGLIGAHAGRFAPSMAVAVLRGGAQSKESRDPELQTLPQWGALDNATYGELLTDLLSMHAKGYLERAGAKGKKLRLTALGHTALERSGK